MTRVDSSVINNRHIIGDQMDPFLLLSLSFVFVCVPEGR